jgi:NAD(P) transhydrogenase
MTESYDLIAIGAGPAGESAAELATAFGHRALVIEKNKPGGAVTTTGGAPTKTLREAALYLTGFRDRDVYGVSVAAPPEVVLQKVGERTRHVCSLLQEVVADDIARHNVAYRQGTATLGPDRTVIVTTPDGTEETLSAKVILIATGSSPLRPQHIPFDDPDVCDSDEVFRLGRVPKDIFIVGGGPIGVEFATIFHALGVPVTLSDMAERLMPMMDAEMSRLMAETFEKAGVKVILGAGTNAVERVDGKLHVTLSNGMTLHPDALLFAAGRSVNTTGLGLEVAGVQLDARGRIVVDRHFQTTAEGIYAAGDVIGPTLASVAMEQGREAACAAFHLPFKDTVDTLSVSAVYGVPEVAGAGLTEEQCQAQGIDYEVGKADLALTPRGAIAGHGGLLKLIFRTDTRQLLGVHCIGDIASELVGIGQMIVHFGGRLDDLNAVTLNTPTYSYAYKYAAFDGLRRLADSQRHR